MELFPETRVQDVVNVVNALTQIRTNLLKDEYTLHQIIKRHLEENGISFLYEYRLGKGSRVDFFTAGGTVIEAKKRKPNENTVFQQIHRYAAFDEVKSVVLVIERYMVLPERIHDKPCYSIGLNKLWGIASK